MRKWFECKNGKRLRNLAHYIPGRIRNFSGVMIENNGVMAFSTVGLSGFRSGVPTGPAGMLPDYPACSRRVVGLVGKLSTCCRTGWRVVGLAGMLSACCHTGRHVVGVLSDWPACCHTGRHVVGVLPDCPACCRRVVGLVGMLSACCHTGRHAVGMLPDWTACCRRVVGLIVYLSDCPVLSKLSPSIKTFRPMRSQTSNRKSRSVLD